MQLPRRSRPSISVVLHAVIHEGFRPHVPVQSRVVFEGLHVFVLIRFARARVCVGAFVSRSPPLAPHSKDVPTRVKHLTDNFTLVLLADVSRSLFAKDKVWF